MHRGTSSAAPLQADVGWILQNARENASDPNLRSAAGFARALPTPVYRATPARWESGESVVTHAIVRDYERVLGLPQGQLTASIDVLSRNREPVRTTGLLPAPLPARWTSLALDLLELALSDQRMSGSDWDALSAMLGANPDALLRSGDWQHLIRRCILEAGVNTGLEFVLRTEALSRLAGHPRSVDVITQMVRAALADPATQIYSDVVGLIQYSHHPDHVALLLTELERPATDQGLWVCLYAMTTLVMHGALDADQRVRAGRAALALLTDGTHTVRVHRAAANLLQRLDPPIRARLIAALRARSKARLANVLEVGSPAALEESRRISVNIQRDLGEQLGPNHQLAPTLRRLLSTITSVTHDETRGNALAVLMLSPQAPTVGGIYARHLLAALEQDDSDLVDDALGVLSWLVHPPDASSLIQAALSTTTTPESTRRLLTIVGNCPTHQPDQLTVAQARRIISQVTSWAETQIGSGKTGAQPQAQPEGVFYLLGMWGQFTRIRRLVQQASAAASPRRDWVRSGQAWLNLPPWARPSSASTRQPA